MYLNCCTLIFHFAFPFHTFSTLCITLFLPLYRIFIIHFSYFSMCHFKFLSQLYILLSLFPYVLLTGLLTFQMFVCIGHVFYSSASPNISSSFNAVPSVTCTINCWLWRLPLLLKFRRPRVRSIDQHFPSCVNAKKKKEYNSFHIL